LTRESIRTMLESVAGEPYFRILSEAKDGQEVIEVCRLQRPDLVLMDVGMPKVNGFEATRTIKAEFPSTKVLILSAHFDPFLVSEIERAGADGYVMKLCSVQELVDAMRACLEASLNTLEVSTDGQCRKPEEAIWEVGTLPLSFQEGTKKKRKGNLIRAYEGFLTLPVLVVFPTLWLAGAALASVCGVALYLLWTSLATIAMG
jgi:CheY-like chemotaxis protein